LRADISHVGTTLIHYHIIVHTICDIYITAVLTCVILYRVALLIPYTQT